MNDTLNLIGTILTKPAERDAIHVAVAPAIASEELQPGQHVGPGGSPLLDFMVVSAQSPVKIGIVDPFLSGSVKKGEHFYLFMYPKTVTTLRHEWTHPAFQEKTRGELLAEIAYLEDRIVEQDCGC